MDGQVVLRMFHTCCPRFLRETFSFLVVALNSMAKIPHAHEIVPGLWLGDRNAAKDDVWLLRNKVSAVFNITKDLPFSPRIQKQYRIPIDDNLQADEIRNMTLWSQEIVYKMLEQHTKGNVILVHCFAGMQRSAAAVAMYLITTKGMSWQQAITYIQSIRPIAFRPSPNFRDSLIEFDKTYHREILPRLSYESKTVLE